MPRAYIHLALALVLAAAVPACTSRYGKPAAMAPSSTYARDDAFYQTILVDGLVEFGRSFPFRHRPKGTGRLTISPETIGWVNSDHEERSFSIRPAAVKSVTMECATRAGGNVCLEIVLRTITGLEYHFRDVDWAGGYNERIRSAHDHLERTFPRMLFAEKIVGKIE